MNSKHVIDSYAWIEYFRGTNAGEQAREYIEGKRALTPTLVLAELSDKYVRENISGLNDDVFFLKSRSQIIPLNEDIALLAGKLNAAMKKKVRGWGMADSIILATANIHDAKVVTGDEHFRDVSEAVMIK